MERDIHHILPADEHHGQNIDLIKTQEYEIPTGHESQDQLGKCDSSHEHHEYKISFGERVELPAELYRHCNDPRGCREVLV